MKIHSCSRLAALAPSPFIILLLGAALPLAASGCGGPSEVVGEELGSTVSALTVTSGHITTQIKTCAWTAASRTPETTCTVDSGFVMIGGGAEINGEVNGAVLRASAPAQDSDTAWVARSVGLANTTHQLRAYVIGLKLEGISDTSLASVVFKKNDIADDELAPVLQDYVMFSGGTIGLPTTDTTRAVKWSYPKGTGEWSAALKVGDPAVQQKTYAVLLYRCPLAWAYGCLTTRVKSVGTASGTGFQTAQYTTPSPWVTTGIGASQSSSTDKRYLADLIPLNGTQQGFTVRTQNVGGTDSATTRGYAVELIANGSIWDYRAIKFRTNNEHFASGTIVPNGAVLQETKATPGTRTNWYLQAIRGGVFLLRNALPTAGGSCAHAGGQGLINISSECSGGSAEWSVETDLGATFPSSFRLRNLGTDQCIDTGGLSGADSNLVFRSCDSVSTQDLTLDIPNTQ